MLVLSYIHILWAISGLIGSRVFSGFFLARSVHKGGISIEWRFTKFR